MLFNPDVVFIHLQPQNSYFKTSLYLARVQRMFNMRKRRGDSFF